MRARALSVLIWFVATGEIVAGAGCGSSSTLGGVLVRWRLMDAVTGTAAKSCGEAWCPGTASCVTVDPDRDGNNGADITIDNVLLRTELITPDGTVSEQPCTSCIFPCNPPEHTTQFELPPGAYRLSIEAYSCGVRVGSTPAPLVRDIGNGDLIDMNVQEVLLSPKDARLTTAVNGQLARCARGTRPLGGCPAPFSPVDAGITVAPDDLGLDMSLDMSLDLRLVDLMSEVDASPRDLTIIATPMDLSAD